MPVYLKLQSNAGDRNGKDDRTVAIQKCGNPPYELSLRFAGCSLKCGACFAAGYSWEDKYRLNRNVAPGITIEQVVQDFESIPRPVGGKFNWLRVLGGEPFLNDEYTQFLLEILARLVRTDAAKFNCGIIIQTNGIYFGRGNTGFVTAGLRTLHELNPGVIVAVETSIKGTNPDEFALVSRSDRSLYEYNLGSYRVLQSLGLPNLRASVVAGYGISESYLLTDGAHPKSMMTILSDEHTPTFHPQNWSHEFAQLYGDFTSTFSKLDPMFMKMPMYGIKDQFEYGWVRPAIKNAQNIYKSRWYDAAFRNPRDPLVERGFREVADKFMLKNNQEYYSALTRH